MKYLHKFLSVFLLLALVFLALVSCKQDDSTPAPDGSGDNPPPAENVDYVAATKLDLTTDSLKLSATVETYVDGDTTHFHVSKIPECPVASLPEGTENGVVKVRYLAVNTPENTSKIEPWGASAANFTRERLSSATSIILESDDNQWNYDSTSSHRTVAWVWYRTSETSDYRNLNMELLQAGLGIASNTLNNRYGTNCMAALAQAKAQKLKIYSNQNDPDYYYGDAIEMTLKELRTNLETYKGKKVAFNGVVTANYNNGIFVEDYDEETDLYFGIYIYYGFGLSGGGLRVIKPGNEVRIVGTLTYWETGGAYQMADLSYNTLNPNDPSSLHLISEGHTPAYRELTADTFLGKTTMTVMVGEGDDATEEQKIYDYAEVTMDTSVSMKNLLVKSIYTTNNGGSSDGAMTITCEVDGKTVVIRTAVLKDASGNVITADAYQGKTIDVRGFVGVFDGNYQIRVITAEMITVQE